MKKITEHSIERYIRFSYTLTEEQKKDIRKALQTSEEARKMYDFLKSYYDELDAITKSVAGTFPLTLKRKSKGAIGSLVLAAATSSTPLSTLVTKATLISEEHKTLVRVLEDQADRSLQFHVIGEDADQCSHAILSLQKPEMDLVTNEFGKLKNVRQLSDVHWDEVASVLRLPVQRTVIDAGKSTEEFYVEFDRRSGVRIKVMEDQVKLEFSKEETISRVLLVSGEDSELYRVTKKSLLLKRPIHGKAGFLYFYK